MASRSSLSPSSSPRLPSPPPMAEDQTGPQSPHIGEGEKRIGSAPVDHAASRRIRPGTKAADMHEGPPLVELQDIDSPFQLTEHLKALHYHYIHPDNTSYTGPLSKHHATLLSQPPSGTDRPIWLYELCRFLVQKVNVVIVGLFADQPPCSSHTCPEMRASEWQYLCAVHDPPKPCCAIDYCCHTLDWAANTLTSPKHFPSRLSLGTEHTVAHSQVRQLTNIFRRVYRIFAHAWFSHRDMFWRVESRSGLYVFFKTVCDVYNLIPEDNYTIPPEAEGKEPTDIQTPLPPSVLKRDYNETNNGTQDNESSLNSGLTPGATARRHRQTPSMGASVATVPEENEDEEEQTIEEQSDGTSSLSSSVTISPSPAEETTAIPSSSEAEVEEGGGGGGGEEEEEEEEETSTSAFPALTSSPGLSRSATSIRAFDSPTTSSSSPPTAQPPLVDPVVATASESETSLPEPSETQPPDPTNITISTSTDTLSPDGIEAPTPIATESAKAYSGFSPASPKASTLGELEKQRSEEAGGDYEENETENKMEEENKGEDESLTEAENT